MSLLRNDRKHLITAGLFQTSSDSTYYDPMVMSTFTAGAYYDPLVMPLLVMCV